MAKVHTQTVERLLHFYPANTAIVTVHWQGKDNAMAAAWNMPVSMSPPVYAVAISPRRYTHELIQKAREFAVNFVPAELAELVLAIGGVSGRETDKFARFGVAKDEAFTTAPVLREAYAAYECRLIDSRTYGDHDLILGEIVGLHYDDACFDEAGLMRPDRARPVLYMGDDYFATVDASSFRRLDRAATVASYRRPG